MTIKIKQKKVETYYIPVYKQNTDWKKFILI